ncbi:30S ribosomal protein S18 [Candidatus Peregrinibacteria bacterium CG08_land_8_20_14_0_20_41_10]|nr:MAG: 30S ribosomal protein S18 [Candidatus Peregrinibacteria bacterium CG1_02_41_10]PIS32022.1 MAG: 30S ribosomal protein S18 [Candidatus Peregrinibacteria bacterium CG08_land_8_20_14_0_20_41_10]
MTEVVNPYQKKKNCFFCKKKITYIDYKNIKQIRPFTDRFGRIKKCYYTGTCLRHQKILSVAIKNARLVALLPFAKR